MDKQRNWLDWFYYAAPVWLLLETFAWPNFRAGVVTGGSVWGNVAFYTVEAGLGVALFYRLPFARPAALLENVAQLIFVVNFILFGSLYAALQMAEHKGDGSLVSYTAALPGAIYSLAYIGFRVMTELRRFRI